MSVANECCNDRPGGSLALIPHLKMGIVAALTAFTASTYMPIYFRPGLE
jgi:hypothetical protein